MAKRLADLQEAVEKLAESIAVFRGISLRDDSDDMDMTEEVECIEAAAEVLGEMKEYEIWGQDLEDDQ